MVINHNVASLNTYNRLSANQTTGNKSLEKLSSGLRINKAGDDAAGLAISEKMRAQIRGLDMASKNAQDGISLVQTAEGALNETQSILQRIRELAVQANNGTNSTDDVQKIQDEIDELVTEIGGIADRTEFNGQKLLDGTLGATTANVDSNLDGSTLFEIVSVAGAEVGANYTLTSDDGTNDTITLTSADGSLAQTITVANVTSVAAGTRLNFDKIGVTLEAVATVNAASIAANNTFDVTANGISFQIGSNDGQDLDVAISDMSADQIGSGVGQQIDSVDVTDFVTVTFATQLGIIDDALTDVSAERAKLGAYQNRLEHTIANLDTSSENLQAAESRIRDVDMAKEMMEFTKNNILTQAATAMLAQANQAPQGVLQLLR